MTPEWSDIVGRLQAGPAQGLYAPDPRRSVSGILPTAVELMGLDPGPNRSRLTEVPQSARGRRFTKLFFCLVDSLGLDDVLLRDGPLSRWYRRQGTWLTTVFPSITSTAIVSISHGVPPAVHGIAGHKVWNERVCNVVDMLNLRLEGAQISLPDAGVDVSVWTSSTPVLAADVIGDRRCFHVTHGHLLGSGLSNFVLPRNMTRVGYSTLVEGLSKVRQLLERPGPVAVSFYTSVIDATSHAFGKRSPEFARQLSELESSLVWMMQLLPAKVRAETLFALASDHGQCLFDKTQAIPLSNGRQALYRQWGPHHGLGNSGRVLHLYGDGAPPAEVEEALREDVGNRGVVLDAVRASVLAGGEPGSPPLPAMGSRVAVLHEGGYFDFEQTPARLAASARNLDRFVANHGSLTAEELLVPTVLAGVDELADTAGQ